MKTQIQEKISKNIEWFDKRNTDHYLRHGCFLVDNMSNLQIETLLESMLENTKEEIDRLKHDLEVNHLLEKHNIKE